VGRNYPRLQLKSESSRLFFTISSHRFCSVLNSSIESQRQAPWEVLLPEGVGALQTPVVRKRSLSLSIRSPTGQCSTPDQPQMQSRLPPKGRKSLGLFRAEKTRSRPTGGEGSRTSEPGFWARYPPCSQLTSTLMFSFCERRERTSSTSRLKMAWTRGGCRENRHSGSGPEPERNRGGWGSTQVGGGVAGGAPLWGSRLQWIPAVIPRVARAPRTPARLKGARRGAGREPREPRARAQPRPHIPELAWRWRRALEVGSGERQEA
jgi:hypothetical protein